MAARTFCCLKCNKLFRVDTVPVTLTKEMNPLAIMKIELNEQKITFLVSALRSERNFVQTGSKKK